MDEMYFVPASRLDKCLATMTKEDPGEIVAAVRFGCRSISLCKCFAL